MGVCRAVPGAARARAVGAAKAVEEAEEAEEPCLAATDPAAVGEEKAAAISGASAGNHWEVAGMAPGAASVVDQAAKGGAAVGAD